MLEAFLRHRRDVVTRRTLTGCAWSSKSSAVKWPRCC